METREKGYIPAGTRRDWLCPTCGTPIGFAVDPGYEHNEWAAYCLNHRCPETMLGPDEPRMGPS